MRSEEESLRRSHSLIPKGLGPYFRSVLIKIRVNLTLTAEYVWCAEYIYVLFDLSLFLVFLQIIRCLHSKLRGYN